MRELLSFYDFDGDEIEIVSGSALAAITESNDEIGKEAILKLMEAVEKSIPTPERETQKPFLMPVEDTFSISGRGTVVTGRIETGTLRVGDDVEIVGLKKTQKTTCTGTFPLSYCSPPSCILSPFYCASPCVSIYRNHNKLPGCRNLVDSLHPHSRYSESHRNIIALSSGSLRR